VYLLLAQSDTSLLVLSLRRPHGIVHACGLATIKRTCSLPFLLFINLLQSLLRLLLATTFA
jgi:hypothetical protein